MKKEKKLLILLYTFAAVILISLFIIIFGNLRHIEVFKEEGIFPGNNTGPVKFTVKCEEGSEAVSGGCNIEPGLILEGFGLDKSNSEMSYYDSWYCLISREKFGSRPYSLTVACK